MTLLIAHTRSALQQHNLFLSEPLARTESQGKAKTNPTTSPAASLIAACSCT